MSFLTFEIDPDKLRKFGLKRNRIRSHMREALGAMGRAWHREFLPLHFEESAFDRYGYYMRRGMGQDKEGKAYRRSYTYRKLQKYGHQRPLVLTGETLALSRMLKLVVTAKSAERASARVILPVGLNRKNKFSRIAMRDEVTRITAEEARYLHDVGRRAFREAVARPPANT